MVKRPLLSVALCTYNGEAYLREQLVSIMKQTHLPDELVVYDDCSTDNTLSILNSLRKEAPFTVRIYRNERRLGPTKNFEKAISLSTGKYIALSDQDDVWMPQKLEKLIQVFMDNPNVGYVFSDALICDEKLHPMGYTMWEFIKFTRHEREQFSAGKQLPILLKHNVVTGATLIFDSKLKEIILPIPNDWIHDEWIALLATSAGIRGAFVEEPLILYRQHSTQVIGARYLSLIEQLNYCFAKQLSVLYREQLKYEELVDRLVSIGKLRTEVRRALEAKIEHLRIRQSAIANPRNFIEILKEASTGRYHVFSNGWRTVVCDLLACLKTLLFHSKYLSIP